MTLQKQVYQQQAIGVIGEFADTSATVAAHYVVKANGDVLPAIGRAFTASSKDNEVQVGGSGAFIGIAIGPKQHSCSTEDKAGLSLKDGEIVQICSQGHIYVASKTAVKPNYIAAFDPATGELYAYDKAETATTAKHTVIANAKFILFSAEAAETAILELK